MTVRHDVQDDGSGWDKTFASVNLLDCRADRRMPQTLQSLVKGLEQVAKDIWNARLRAVRGLIGASGVRTFRHHIETEPIKEPLVRPRVSKIGCGHSSSSTSSGTFNSNGGLKVADPACWF